MLFNFFSADPMAIQGPPAADNVPISRDFVHCTEDSPHLLDCPALMHVQRCTHMHDAGVNCTQAIG